MKKFNHLMIDIETMGNQSYSAILSIGAVEFDIETGETGKTFHLRINMQSCIDAELKINADTILWWMQQSEESRSKLTKNTGVDTPVKLKSALESFSAFCTKDYQVWGNSARFDLGIIQNAYEVLNTPIPWDFRKERCLRTLVSFAPEVARDFIRLGTAHDALDDCYHQIKYASATWNKLNSKALPDFVPRNA